MRERERECVCLLLSPRPLAFEMQMIVCPFQEKYSRNVTEMDYAGEIKLLGGIIDQVVGQGQKELATTHRIDLKITTEEA